ncbi:hypothetical protein MBLNU457_1532t1 [Dothideomycetes sp. NU457]
MSSQSPSLIELSLGSSLEFARSSHHLSTAFDRLDLSTIKRSALLGRLLRGTATDVAVGVRKDTEVVTNGASEGTLSTRVDVVALAGFGQEELSIGAALVVGEELNVRRGDCDERGGCEDREGLHDAGGSH